MREQEKFITASQKEREAFGQFLLTTKLSATTAGQIVYTPADGFESHDVEMHLGKEHIVELKNRTSKPAWKIKLDHRDGFLIEKHKANYLKQHTDNGCVALYVNFNCLGTYIWNMSTATLTDDNITSSKYTVIDSEKVTRGVYMLSVDDATIYPFTYGKD